MALKSLEKGFSAASNNGVRVECKVGLHEPPQPTCYATKLDLTPTFRCDDRRIRRVLRGRFLFIAIPFFEIEFFYGVNVQIEGRRAFAASLSNAGLGMDCGCYQRESGRVAYGLDGQINVQ